MVSKLEPPRDVWIMVPAGRPDPETVEELAGLLEDGDTIIDGGNSRWTDDKRRQEELARSAASTTWTWASSGGVWGLRSATA